MPITIGHHAGLWGEIETYRDDIVTIGNYFVLAAGATIITHCPIRLYKENIKINIGDYVYIGKKAVVLPGVNIGNNVMVGAGSIVTHDLPSDSICAGNPCVFKRPLEGKELLRFQKLAEQGKVGNGIEPDYSS